jgi:D-xylose 1-dehydrogenase
VEQIGAAGFPPPLFQAADLRDPVALAATLARTVELLGGIDVLVNNAANDDRHEFATVTPEYWDERIAVNLRHLFFAAQAAAVSMKQNGGGVILNFGSISWHLGLKNLVVYQTAKAGIEGMTRAMARELGGDNIRVNAIIPGNVQTPRQLKWYNPEEEAQIVAGQCLSGRVQPEDIAAMALFLASDDARMCTAHSYWVDAGWR